MMILCRRVQEAKKFARFARSEVAAVVSVTGEVRPSSAPLDSVEIRLLYLRI